MPRNPIALVRARTMPMWPLWLLVCATPVLHLLWLAELFGTSEISLNETRISYESSESQDLFQAFWPELAAVGIAVGVWAWYHYTRRDVNRSRLAGEGWLYRRGWLNVHPGRFTAFPRPLRWGAITNIAWGPWDGTLMSSYTLWTSKVHRYSVSRVELESDLPSVVVVPLGWFERFAQLFEFAPFHVESAQFNATWRVVAADPRVASAVLHPRMIEHLISGQVAPNVGITIDDAALLVWSPGAVSTKDLDSHLIAAKELASLIPDYVHGYLGTPRPADWGPWSMREWVSSPAALAAADQIAAQREPVGGRRAVALGRVQAQRDAYFASAAGQLELAHPQWFGHGATGLKVVANALVAVPLLFLMFTVNPPLFLLGLVAAAVGAVITGVNARRIAQSLGTPWSAGLRAIARSLTLPRGSA